MEIKVLGPGCAKCYKMEEMTKNAVKKLGIDARVEKISEIQEIMRYTMSTPRLVVNGKLKHSGKPLPSIEKLKRTDKGGGSIMQDLMNIFKALSEETRLRILKLLEHGELCVCDIVAALDMVQPKVSFHLNALKEAGFLKDRKQGRWTHYSIDDSDFFRRALLLSVFERIPKETEAVDRKRLDDFMRGNTSRDKVVPLAEKKRCAGRCK